MLIFLLIEILSKFRIRKRRNLKRIKGRNFKYIDYDWQNDSFSELLVKCSNTFKNMGSNIIKLKMMWAICDLTNL